MPSPTEYPFPIYLSGPMFSAADLWSQQAICAALETPVNPEVPRSVCYLPQRDGIEVGKVIHLLNSPRMVSSWANQAMELVRKVVFALDMYQLLERCGAVVFNMDGRVPDGGSVVETSAAFTSGRVVVIYKSTPITMLGGFDNPMISGLSHTWSYVESVGAVPEALAAQLRAQPDMPTFTPDTRLAEILRLGKTVWEDMDEIRAIIDQVTKWESSGSAIAEVEEILKPMAGWLERHLLDR